MTDRDNGGQAFPQDTVYVGGAQQMIPMGPRGGMTLRDYFAAKVIAAVQQEIGLFCNEKGIAANAAYAYEVADAMLKARAE